MTERYAYVVGVDTGLVGALREADHLLRGLAVELGAAEDVWGCTHHVRDGGRPHTALSFAVPSERAARAAVRRLAEREFGVALGAERHGPADLAAGAARAAAEHAERTGGRAVLYPGAEALTGTVTVARLLAGSAVDRVAVLGAPDGPEPERRIVTRDHVRPEWREGQLVLTTMPAAGGTLVPFEVPEPTPCCADH
ncbi:hypothetical protein GCM10011579_096190 [Streptomyces albiflavescens]|uniref:Uncharacterized protein n=1 Tax=Streptomyces albiflavescens TaxID=1623582 RepID=A0A917YI14_9ACTN|nr:hypothetical protein [Streptomyces albiflavescens]GGN95590.1 hypothetical protein GCM10011579_096190 [Streptomyces albiflavescens]